MIINQSRLVAPCRYCNDRKVGCHSTCELYIEYRKKLDEENALRNHSKHLHMEANQIEVERIMAVKTGKMYDRRPRKSKS